MLFYIKHLSPYVIDKFNTTVRYGVVSYGTGFLLFTYIISHLAMRFVLAGGPFRLLLYRTVHNTVVHRLIRVKSLPIDLDGIKNVNKIFRTSLVYVFRKKAGGLLRIDVEMI